MTFHPACAMAAGIITSSKPSPVAQPPPEAAVNVPWERVERFVGQLIHDIRNGLNALELQLTFLGEISTDPEAAGEVKRLRGTLLEVTRQLQAVKLATSTANPHALEYPATDFFEDLRERVERREPDKASKVAWTVALDAADSLMVDPDLTINGLLEVFANTFRFAGNSVRCMIASDPQRVSFMLEENPTAAPAIDPEHWGREPLLSTARSAYGLGLFRARRILEVQGGSLDAVYRPGENLLRTIVFLPRAAGNAS